MSSKYTKLEPDFRMVLVGRTGTGKSATGNTILGRKAFGSAFSTFPFTSTCQKNKAEFEGKLLAVVDTPGLFDTNKPEEEIKEEMVRCISYSAPGPHVFLVVIQPSRFTNKEKKTIKDIQTMFGKQAARYTMVLFTRGDVLEADGGTIEEFIFKNKDLCDFIRQCGGRYHVFNNRTQNPSQVRELLEKISIMVQSNGGKFYTSKMLEEAERAIQEEMKKHLRENPDMTPEEARRRAERNNKFIKSALAAKASADGAAVGAAAGAAAGVSVVLAAALVVFAAMKCVTE